MASLAPAYDFSGKVRGGELHDERHVVGRDLVGGDRTDALQLPASVADETGAQQRCRKQIEQTQAQPVVAPRDVAPEIDTEIEFF